MGCLAACLPFMWLPISGTLQDFVQRGAREALTFAWHWIVQKFRGTGSSELLANFRHGVVGAEEPLSKTRQLLEDEDSRIIGIYGMGGVGKTTLLKTIHDEYQMRSERFDIVIFVTVSKVFLVDSMQKQIGVKLGFGENFGLDTADRSTKLLNELRKKKFLLLLDDLWEKLDLAEVGIPHADHLKKGSKVVFTTRLIRVCNVMDAFLKVEVPSLSSEKSWELFCKSLGEREDHWTDSTRILAKAVAEKCGGLPLALITVGRAMANATADWEWESALEAIRELQEVEEEVLPSLKFSFDRLRNEEHKECLLYCSLFPEDYSIDVEWLIGYWIGEGLLGSENCSLDKARKRGLAAINDLKSVCLLEHDLFIVGPEEVKLHDMVREMALWITSGKCRTEKITFLVNPGEKLESAPVSNLWADATKVSLMYNNIRELPERPECHNLRTLLLHHNGPLRHIPCGMFQSMPLLTVLDLSHTRIELLPLEIGLLLNLTFLDLSATPIKLLPLEVGKLRKLTILWLHQTGRLKKVPAEAITLLSSLRWFSLEFTRYKWRGGWKGDYGKSGVCFRDLDSLKQLEELYVKIRRVIVFKIHGSNFIDPYNMVKTKTTPIS